MPILTELIFQAASAGRKPGFNRQRIFAQQQPVSWISLMGKIHVQFMICFQPADTPKGLFVFIHGGYWLKLDKTYWSHLAAGARDAGWAIAIPSYVLCPQATIIEITQMIASFLQQAADRVAGPIVVSGHSAGGHLAAMMACQDTELDDGVADRIAHIVSISGVHDLRPLLQTAMKDDLRLDDLSAIAVSPALKTPRMGTRLTTWVGADERPEFRRQSGLLSNLWHGLGAETCNIEDPARHHFDVIDGLADKHSPLMQAILQQV